jgi:hypothetical protein
MRKVLVTWMDGTTTEMSVTSGGFASLVTDPCIDKIEPIK